MLINNHHNNFGTRLKLHHHFSLRAFFFSACSVLFLLFTPLLETSREKPEPLREESLEEVIPEQSLTARLGVKLKRGDTLLTVLMRQGVKPASAHDLIAKVRPLMNLRKLRAGNDIDLVLQGGDRSVQGVEIELEDNIVRAKATTEGWHVERELIPSVAATRVIRGKIAASLYEDGVAAGLSPEHILELAKIFEYDIDFFSDFKRGDDFAVVVEEQHYANGRQVPRRVLAATLQADGDAHDAYYFVAKDGAGSYYDGEGKELRRSFLRAPLSYSRISSFFSVARRHPIFRTLRPHMAIDYAAPMGTPVVAIGRGKVSRSGWFGGYGQFVEIAHANGYASRYGHFSRIASGIRPGAQVNPGDVIGYVGQTGHATGPHLHFEFLQGGKKLNFLALKIPRNEQLRGNALARFKREREAQLALMNAQDPKLALASPAS